MKTRERGRVRGRETKVVGAERECCESVARQRQPRAAFRAEQAVGIPHARTVCGTHKPCGCAQVCAHIWGGRRALLLAHTQTQSLHLAPPTHPQHPPPVPPSTRTHTRTHARTHAHTHARTHEPPGPPSPHTPTHTHTHLHPIYIGRLQAPKTHHTRKPPPPPPTSPPIPTLS